MSLAEALLELQELTERLRRDCPWDREQTARTIVPHSVEEAYGDLARRLNVDPELALRGTTRTFVERVERAAAIAAERGEDWRALGLEEQDRYYDEAKTFLASPGTSKNEEDGS